MAERYKWPNPPEGWVEVSEKQYWYALEVVPPDAQAGLAFSLGEANRHHQGRQMNHMFIEVNDRFFCKLDFLQDFNAKKYEAEVLAKFFGE
jgi:hypothetical protein